MRSILVAALLPLAWQSAFAQQAAPPAPLVFVEPPAAAILTLTPPDLDAQPQQGPFEYSDAYATRNTIHKYASLAIVPMFAVQYLAGDELLQDNPAAWARNWHGGLAAGVAGLFAVNTVTGGWNLLEARKDPEGRGRRTLHGVLMLVGDLGFVATGVAANSTSSRSGRERHRNIAVAAMGISLVSYAIMLPPFRKD